MTKDSVIEIDQDVFREHLLKYTRKAFQLLPKLERPRILDIGCGSGVPTIELAKLCNGEIVGIDTNQSLLDKLNCKIKEKGLSNRISTLRCSMLKLDFPPQSFDIIWNEGSVFVIGFERALLEWSHLLKSDGFLVIHDKIDNMIKKLKKIPKCGYRLIHHFTLSRDVMWREYYEPFEFHVIGLREKHGDNSRALKSLKKYQNEINMVKKSPQNEISVFYIMQKIKY
ncbi:MAG: class I SAM-dependent methyltransferase [Candidatus Hodarchaeales archaeon]|jgi:ubiquinone/menaquinone biosynthesis C-methylase UbiE